jgi:hypothetical protein
MLVLLTAAVDYIENFDVLAWLSTGVSVQQAATDTPRYGVEVSAFHSQFCYATLRRLLVLASIPWSFLAYADVKVARKQRSVAVAELPPAEAQ